MQPIITVEFSAKCGDEIVKEESVPLHSLEEFFQFVAPGGGCESIPDEVLKIQMVFMPLEHDNIQNPLADAHAQLQLGMVIFSGPLSEIVRAGDQILDKAGRGELSDAFRKIICA